jgi:uncharacterized protein DUF222
MSHRNAARIREISSHIDLLALERAQLVAEFDCERGFQLDGASGTVAWLKTFCRLSAGGAIEILSVARRLPELPAVEAAVSAGQIGFQQAAVITEAAERVGSESLLERQAELLEKAEAHDPSALRKEVQKVEKEVDAERMRREAEWAYRSRRLQVTTMSDGRVRLDGLLDAEGGAVVKTALDAALGPAAVGDTRSGAQRRADALVDVAKRALDGRGLGSTGRQSPHLNVVVDGGTGAGEIVGLGPVPRETIERLLCDCALSVNGSPEVRTFNAAKRRALAGREPHCVFTGCDRPAAWCDGHHLAKWDGRNTKIDNGALLCGFHHRLVHEGGWQLTRKDGQWVAIDPYGQKFRSAKAPPAA